MPIYFELNSNIENGTKTHLGENPMDYHDFRNGWVRLCYAGSVYAGGVDYESTKKAYLEK